MHLSVNHGVSAFAQDSTEDTVDEVHVKTLDKFWLLASGLATTKVPIGFPHLTPSAVNTALKVHKIICASKLRLCLHRYSWSNLSFS
jgi:hypothetical protein